MKAIVLLSGGLDSALNLALAIEKGRACVALSFNYGQKHLVELKSAEKLALHYGIPHKIITLDLTTFGKCSLVNGTVVKDRDLTDLANDTLSPNYVPGRNTLFLTHAMAVAEVEGASEIYFGGMAADHAFPDCSAAYIQTMQMLITQAVPHHSIRIVAPLLVMTKTDIVKEAQRLEVPIEITHSCYDPINDGPCGRCDACLIRKNALL